MVIYPLLLLGLMASLSPVTIVVFILLLRTKRARVNAFGFLVGWGSHSQSSSPPAMQSARRVQASAAAAAPQ